jgi:hypothetical protein
VSSITEAILGAWEEDEAPAAESEGAEPDATLGEDEVQDEAPSDEVEETPEVEEGAIEEEEEEVSDEPGEVTEAEEPSEEEEPEEVSEEETEPAESAPEDAEAQAYLARHGGDVDAALRAAASQEKILGRQGRELGMLRARVEELEADAEQAALFGGGAQLFTGEQQAWVEEAVGSENPLAYIQLAMQEGEFDLARAVLDQGEFSAAQVVRLSQGIDAAEGRSMQVAPEQLPLDHQTLMGVLIERYPDMPKYEADMVASMKALGPEHPLVALSRSQDPGEAAQGIIGLYEIARARSTTLASTREDVKKKGREAADDVRRRGQVSSAQATRRQAQAPRQRPLMPGLTLEALEAEFDTE